MTRYHYFSHNQHAVVLGAGIDGLLTARVLTEYFQRVTVIAEDSLPAEPGLPQDVWQALPSHVLGVQGGRNLERLFPGLTAELMTAGAPTVEWTADAPMLLPDGWTPRFHSDLVSRPVTLNLLRHIIRQRLLDYAGGRVSFLEKRAVQRLQGYATIEGIVLRHDGQDETLAADLVVDASGRRARLPGWLPAQPEDTQEPVQTGLAVRLFRRPPNYQPGWQALLVWPRRNQPGVVLMPVEGGAWLVMLLTPCANVPSTEAEFMQLARSSATPVIYEALQRALPLTPVFSLPAAQSLCWHYQRAAGWPDGLIVTGTAALAFHPALGLDVTTATMAALALRESLDDHRKHQPQGGLMGLARRYHKRLSRLYALPWQLWTADRTDYSGRLLRWYTEHVFKAARAKPQTLYHLLATAGLIAPARTLLKPAVVHQLFQAAALPNGSDDQPPAFEPLVIHKTITQEIAALAQSKDP